MTLEEFVKNHLEDMASNDANFRERYEDKDKSLKECLQYITEQAREQAVSGCAAIASDDVANWAVHYYQEKDCKPKCNVQAKVSAVPSAPKADVKAERTSTPKPKKRTETKAKAVELDLFGGF